MPLQLQDRKTENERRCSAFRTKIQELWERLHIPQEEREALSEHMVTSKKRNIEAVRNLPHVVIYMNEKWIRQRSSSCATQPKHSPDKFK